MMKFWTQDTLTVHNLAEQLNEAAAKGLEFHSFVGKPRKWSSWDNALQRHVEQLVCDALFSQRRDAGRGEPDMLEYATLTTERIDSPLDTWVGYSNSPLALNRPAHYPLQPTLGQLLGAGWRVMSTNVNPGFESARNPRFCFILERTRPLL